MQKKLQKENKKVSTVEVRQQRDKAFLLEKLKEVPIVQVACRKASVSRATYYRWRIDDLVFADKCEDAIKNGNELINDMSESQIISLIQDKKLPAIVLWLKHHHPTYGAKDNRKSRNAEVTLTLEQSMVVERALKIAKPKLIGKRKRHE